jgi:uncharacterized protein
MNQDPVTIVQGMYDAFERGDIAAVLNFMHSDVEWVESEAQSMPTRGIHSGHEQIVEHIFDSVPRDWLEFAIIPEDFFVDGNTVIVRGRVRAIAKATGRSMDAPYVHIFEISDGKLRRYTDHQDTAIWAETLGYMNLAARSDT